MRLNEIFDIDYKLTPDELAMFEDHMKAMYDLDTFSITLDYNRNTIYLHNVVVNNKKQGTGTAVMTELCRFADDHGASVYLTPDDKNRHTGTTSKNRLVRFYRRFGFVPNKGRNKDFATMAGMLRRPVKTPAGISTPKGMPHDQP